MPLGAGFSELQAETLMPQSIENTRRFALGLADATVSHTVKTFVGAKAKD